MNRGLGRGIAARLLALGVNVLGTVRTKEERLKSELLKEAEQFVKNGKK